MPGIINWLNTLPVEHIELIADTGWEIVLQDGRIVDVREVNI